MRSQGRAFVQWTSREERARFITYVQSRLDEWRYAQDGRTWPELAERTGISMDQISKWLRGTQVPSKESVEKLFKAGVFTEDPEWMIGSKPWLVYAPDVRALAEEEPRPARTSKKKKAKPAKRTASLDEVTAPPVEIAAPDIFEILAADTSISATNKMKISALIALAQTGAELDVEVKVRAR